MLKRIKKRIGRGWCWLTHDHTKRTYQVKHNTIRTRKCNHCHRKWIRVIDPYAEYFGAGV